MTIVVTETQLANLIQAAQNFLTERQISKCISSPPMVSSPKGSDSGSESDSSYNSAKSNSEEIDDLKEEPKTASEKKALTDEEVKDAVEALFGLFLDMQRSKIDELVKFKAALQNKKSEFKKPTAFYEKLQFEIAVNLYNLFDAFIRAKQGNY